MYTGSVASEAHSSVGACRRAKGDAASCAHRVALDATRHFPSAVATTAASAQSHTQITNGRRGDVKRREATCQCDASCSVVR